MNEIIEKYGTAGIVTVGEQEFPLVNIPMMSDEKWQKLAIENAIHNFTIVNGRKPVNVDEAVKWKRALIADIEDCLVGTQGKETA